MESTERANRSRRYRWRRFLDQRDAEIESLGEIAALAQSVDDGAYSNEQVLKNAAANASQPSAWQNKPHKTIKLWR